MFHNNKIFQNFNEPPMCSHLCLIRLQKLSKDEGYKEILMELKFSIKNNIFFINKSNKRRTAKRNYQ
jgi:hypothetical protein